MARSPRIHGTLPAFKRVGLSEREARSMPDTVAGRPRLLLAEDDLSLAAMMRESLEDDFRVEVAADGRQAVRLAHDGHPDVMVMDARMPRMDGFEACRALR